MMLNSSQREMLLKIIKQHVPNCDSYMPLRIDETMAAWKVDLICDWIGEEFLSKGIKDDWEPNQYGFELELLLDAVNRLRQGR
jgi:hypothetical protein